MTKVVLQQVPGFNAQYAYYLYQMQLCIKLEDDHLLNYFSKTFQLSDFAVLQRFEPRKFDVESCSQPQ